MTILAQSTDYTDKDFDALRARLRTLIISVFPTWTNDQVANFGNLLVELYAFVGDVLGFYQDNQAGESRITTATQRKNLIALTKLIGYTPESPSAATADVTFTLDGPVPAGRTVTFNPPGPPAPATNPTTVLTTDTENPVEMQLTAAVVIPATESVGNGTVKNSIKQEDETFAASGLPSQEVALANTPFLDASAVVTDDGGAFVEVESFLQSTASDKHFIVLVDANDRAGIRFGNGVNGAIPVGTITIGYETGGGSTGNVEAGTLTRIDGSFVDSTGAPVSVSTTNASAAGGGNNRESDASIKENGPLSIRAINRTVAREDFEIHAKQVVGVARALMLTKDEKVAIAENAGELRVVPEATTFPGFPSTTIKDAVLAQITTVKPHTLTFKPSVLDPLYLDIGVEAVLFLKQGFVGATVRDDIIDNLKNFFKLDQADGTENPNVEFGFNRKDIAGIPSSVIALSDIFNVVRDTVGVLRVELPTFKLVAFRVDVDNDAYTGGGDNAVLVQALASTDVPIGIDDFPRLKTTVLGNAVADVDLTIDGVGFPA